MTSLAASCPVNREKAVKDGFPTCFWYCELNGMLWVGCSRGELMTYDVKTHSRLFRNSNVHDSRVLTLTGVIRNEKGGPLAVPVVYSVDELLMVGVWDVRTGDPIRTIRKSQSLISLAKVFVGDDFMTPISSGEADEQKQGFHRSDVVVLFSSPTDENTCNLCVWNISSGKRESLAEMKWLIKEIMVIEEKSLWGVGRRGLLFSFDLPTKRIRKEWRGHSDMTVNDLCLVSNDPRKCHWKGHHVWTCGDDGKVWVWNYGSMNLLDTLDTTTEERSSNSCLQCLTFADSKVNSSVTVCLR